MAQLVDFTQFKSAYINDRKEFFRLSDEERARRRGEYIAALEKSTTLYVGNISFFTTETQVHEIFSRCGVVKQIIMGLDRIHKTPCGFCFVEFEKREEAEDAMKYLNQTRLDDRIIRLDWDKGNVLAENRQYGRGLSGGQVRDEYREELDRGRGGMGKRRARDLGLEVSDWTKGLVQYEREDKNPERLGIRPEKWGGRRNYGKGGGGRAQNDGWGREERDGDRRDNRRHGPPGGRSPSPKRARRPRDEYDEDE